MPRILVVQCCHLPQFFYIAERLRDKHPDWILDALVVDHPQVHFYLKSFSCFNHVYFSERNLPQQSQPYEKIIFPLLNRGYRKIKKTAASFPVPAYEISYEGRLLNLQRSRLLRSLAVPLHKPTEEFIQYFRSFPHRPLGERILLIESCHPSLISKTETQWKSMIPSGAQVTRVAQSNFWKVWRGARRDRPDGAVVFFSGEKGFAKLKLLPFALGLSRIVVFNESAGCFYASARSLGRFVYERFRRGVSLPRSAPRVLLIQTEMPRYVVEAARKLRQENLFPKLHLSLLCREEDRLQFQGQAEFNQILTYSQWNFRKNLRLLRQIRKFDADLVSAIFSGRPIFRKQKLFFFLFPARRHLAFNAGLDCYDVTPRTFARLFQTETLLFDVTTPETRLLLVQTETPRYVLEAAKRLKQDKLFPRSKILLVCRDEDRPELQHRPEFNQILTFPQWNFRENLRLLRQMRKFDADLASAVFSGRPIFRKQKLFFLLFPARRHLVFNAGLDCYDVAPRTFARLFKKEPLLFDKAGTTRALLIQSAGDAETLKALEELRNPRVAPGVRISVFCSEDKRGIFEGAPGVEQVFSYDAREWRQVCSTLWQLLRMRPDVVAGIFSGQPTFRKQKMLFFLLPARSRLAFNENLDCFYLNWRNFHQVFPEIRDPALAPLRAYTRQVLKGLLFLPRFFYLVMWVTVMKARRAYTQAGK